MAPDLDIVEVMAKAIFEARYVYYQALDMADGMVPWDHAPAGQKHQAWLLAREAHDLGEIDFENVHNKEVQELLETGWTGGPTIDPVAKTSPFLVPFNQLPVPVQCGFGIYETMLIYIKRFYELQ